MKLLHILCATCAKHLSHKPIKIVSAGTFIAGAAFHGTQLGFVLTAVHVATWVLAD